jgi:tripartite-type tricarboxylate transporter receptor subunit TctC
MTPFQTSPRPAAVVPTASRIAWAQAYPTRPVRIIVGFAPAGGTDIMARLIGQWLSERLDQQFVIENWPGAGTNIATEAVVNAPPDCYTLLLACLPNASNATLYDKLNFNFIRDIAPVAGIARDTFAIEVNLSVPVKTVPELIAYAKVNSGKINMASGGIGSGNHIFGELFKMMTGVNLVHVPYRGAGPASRLRQSYCRGNSEVGRGGEVRGHQAAVSRVTRQIMPTNDKLLARRMQRFGP